MEKSTARAVERGKLTDEERAAALGRIRFTTDISELADRDLAIEAVTEDLEIKGAVVADLDKVLAPGVIIATNTSSLSVTHISVVTGRPDRVVGMHFFNPAPVQSFMEIVRTVVTAPDVVDQAVEFAESLGKEPVVVGDRAGFIANALLFGYLNHAANMYEARYASREDIDAAMRLGCGYPMGPLALLDLIGLDTAYKILDTMYKESRDRLHAPAPIIKQMVTAGMKGRKSGQGFYTYEAPGSSTVVADALTPAAGGAFGAGRTIDEGGRRRLRDDGHGDHRGLHQVRLRDRLRGALAREDRRRARRARAVADQGRAAREADRGGHGRGIGPRVRDQRAR